MKEKLFEGEKGVFIGSGKTVFGENGFGSLMAVPMIENDTVFGFAILLKKDLYAFTFEMYKLFQALIHVNERLKKLIHFKRKSIQILFQ